MTHEIAQLVRPSEAWDVADKLWPDKHAVDCRCCLLLIVRWDQVFDSFACIPSDTWTRRWCIFQPHKIDRMLPFSFSASAQTFVVKIQHIDHTDVPHPPPHPHQGSTQHSSVFQGHNGISLLMSACHVGCFN